MTQLADLLSTPVANIKPAVNQAEHQARWATPRIYLDYGLYSQPILHTDNTFVRCLRRQGYNGHLDPVGLMAEFPKNGKPSGGTDGQATVITPHGNWDFWGYMGPQNSNGFQRALQYLYNFWQQHTPNDVYVGSAAFTPSNQQGNALSYGPSWPISPTIPLLAEFQANLIPHAISMTTPTPQGGTPMPLSPSGVPANRDYSAVSSGVQGTVSPALLNNGSVVGSKDAATGVVMGMRAYLKWTDKQLTAWYLTKPIEHQSAARTLGRCLIDYGFVITQVGGAAAAPLNGVDAPGYAKILDAYLLDGIDPKDFVWLTPPTSVYADGSTGTTVGFSSNIFYP